jgi:NAD(P)-dependent dehydrogenase (short-subunit alcohol dehydrogenase family)
MRVVVTGSNRGLGHALAGVLRASGHEVFAPDRAALDVTSDASCDAFARGIRVDRVDAVVNNAAIGSFGPITSATSDELLREYDTNAVGAFRVVRALLPMIVRARGKIVHVSSDMASLAAGPTKGTGVGYRMSKVALNMLSANLAAALRDDGVASYCVHPGWLKTTMGGPNATIDPAVAASKLARLIEMHGIASTGRFMDLDGKDIAW